MTPEWHKDAACSLPPYGPETARLWFPHKTDLKSAKEAIRVCLACPVREACLEDALRAEHGTGDTSRFGIFGGRSPRQRYGLYLARQRAELKAAGYEV